MYHYHPIWWCTCRNILFLSVWVSLLESTKLIYTFGYKTHLQKIESYQNKVLKIIKCEHGPQRNPSLWRIKHSQTKTVEDIHIMEVAKILYSIWNKQQQHNLSLYFSKISQQHTHTTRFRFRSSFICQGTSTRRQRRDLCGLRVKLPRVTTSLTTHR